jgi:hypothetical protein
MIVLEVTLFLIAWNLAGTWPLWLPYLKARIGRGRP